MTKPLIYLPSMQIIDLEARIAEQSSQFKAALAEKDSQFKTALAEKDSEIAALRAKLAALNSQ